MPADDLRARRRRFVRETLGCGCPDEVLDAIRAWTGGPAPPGAEALLGGLDVGGRLLVLALAPASYPPSPDWLQGVVAEGMRVRDRDGFNRLRLVLALPEQARAEGLSRDWRPPDDRCHLHTVPAGELAGLFPRD